MGLPTGAAARKALPIATWIKGYFPDALMYLCYLSYKANEQHNPGEPMHWSREKSTDQEDCMMRHWWEQGEVDTDGLLHTGKAAWRNLAMLQLEIEERGGLGNLIK